MTEEILIREPGKKPALHQSVLAGLSKCSMQVYFRYVEGRKVPPGIALLVGTATHAAADMALVNKAKKEDPLPVEALQEKARDTLLAQVKGEGVVLDAEDGESVEGGVDEAVGLVRCYHREVLPVRTPASPAHVERRLRAVLEGFPFDLEGTIDLQEADGSLRDLKTSAREPAEDAAIGNVQLDAYALLSSVADGKMPTRLGLDTVVKAQKKRGPRFVPRHAPPPASFEHVVLRLEAAAKVFETGSFYPVDPKGPSGWACSAKWCGYWQDVCPFGRRSRTTFPVGGGS